MRNFRDRHRHPGGPLAARRASGGAFTPSALGPDGWWDVKLSGSASQIADLSGYGRAAIAYGAAAAAPAWSSGQAFAAFDGTDDYAELPAAALPTLDTQQAKTALVVVFSRSSVPSTSGHPIVATKANATNATLGFTLRAATTAGSATLVANVGDGTNADTASSATLAFGTIGVVSLSIGDSSPFVNVNVNAGASTSSDSTRTTTGATSTGGVLRIGSFSGGGVFTPMKLYALLRFDRLPSAAELSALTTYYNGGTAG